MSRRPLTPLLSISSLSPHFFVSDDQFAELRAPVSEVIDTDDVIAERAVYAVKRRADRSIEHMSHVERFGDIDRGIVYAHGLAGAFFGPAVLAALSERPVQHLAGYGLFVQSEVDVRTDRLSLFQKVVRAYARNHVFCELGGTFAELSRELETRQTPVAH